MVFKTFKQAGREIIINLENVVFISMDTTSNKTIIYSTTHTNEVDVTFEEVKKMLGAARGKEVGF